MSGSTRTRRGAEAEQVVNTIKERLRVGRYAPGHRLIENDLISDFGTTRAVVREALRWLAAEDLIEITPYRGAAVSGLSRRDVENIYDVLAPLAIYSARLAAERIDIGDNRKLAKESLAATRRFKNQATVTRKLPELAAENVRFHGVVRQIAGNPKIVKICEQLELQLVRILFPLVLVEDVAEMWNARHEEVLLQILNGDGDKAAAEMAAFAGKSHQVVQSLPDSVFN